MRRLGLFPWLGVWVVLTVLQVGALAAMFPLGGADEPMLSPLVALSAVVVLQLLRWPVTVGRLLDLGRPPEDAVLLLVPLVSLGLTGSLLRGTPPDRARAKTLKAWEGRTLAATAVWRGLRALLAAPLITLPAVLVTGAAAASIEALALPAFRELTLRQSLRQGRLGPPSDEQVLAFQIVLGVLGVLGIWLVLNLLKRKTASRASWLPTLAMLPLTLAAVALWPGLAEIVGPDQAPPGFFTAALTFGWWVFGGGILATLFIAIADDKRTHGAVNLGRAMGVWGARWPGALAVHGGTATVIFLGLQALWIPGLVYALMMAFTVHIAMLHPQDRPFRGSARLTRGWWRPVFNVLALGVVPGLVLQVLGVLVVDVVQVQLGYPSPFVDEAGVYQVGRMLAGWVTVQAMPGSVGLPALGVGLGAALNALATGAATAGLVWTYHERRERKASKSSGTTRPAEKKGLIEEE